jgi:hypothetical protein
VVAGFGIDEERTSATRYIGKISVQFRADAVRRLLQDNPAAVFGDDEPPGAAGADLAGE